MKLRFALIALLPFIFANVASAQTKLQTGVWRGVLKTASGKELPFNFDVSNAGTHQQLAIINGAERFKVTDIKTKGDSVFIHMPLFNSEFKLKFAGKGLKGQWIKHLGVKDALMAFTAEPGTDWRFVKNPDKPAANLSGRWRLFLATGRPTKKTWLASLNKPAQK